MPGLLGAFGEQDCPDAFFMRHITILFSTTPSVAGVLRLKITSLNGALALRINKVTGTLRKRQGSGEQKQQRPSLRMAVCITHDLNVSRSVWTGCLPARLTGLTTRFTRLGFINR